MEEKLNYVAPKVEIVYGEYPPIFDRIKEVFPLAGKTTIFAFGDKIYVPGADTIDPEILAHERVHCERQLKIGVLEWWAMYLQDKNFRLNEEVLAHRVEYSFLRGLFPGREKRNAILCHVAGKLAHPLYGRMVTMKYAKELVKNENKR